MNRGRTSKPTKRSCSRKTRTPKGSTMKATLIRRVKASESGAFSSPFAFFFRTQCVERERSQGARDCVLRGAFGVEKRERECREERSLSRKSRVFFVFCNVVCLSSYSSLPLPFLPLPSTSSTTSPCPCRSWGRARLGSPWSRRPKSTAGCRRHPPRSAAPLGRTAWCTRASRSRAPS